MGVLAKTALLFGGLHCRVNRAPEKRKLPSDLQAASQKAETVSRGQRFPLD